MPIRRYVCWLSLVCAVLVQAGPVASRSATLDDRALANAAMLQRDTARARTEAAAAPPFAPRAIEARQRRLKLETGDHLSASAFKNKALQVRATNGKVISSKVKGGGLTPRGVDYDPVTAMMAIAAVDRVVLWDPALSRTTEVPGPDGEAFGFANDVRFDGLGGLIIADQGLEPIASTPTDGAIWRYDLTTGELIQIATGKALANPKLLSFDKNGVLHFIDGGAGPLVSPVTEVRWDILYSVEGKNLSRVKPVWNKPGIQATAYEMSSSGWHWIVNVGELIRIKGNKMEQPCLPPYPMKFATGLLLNSDGTADVMDGANVVSKDRALLNLTSLCVTTGKADRKLKGARGLTRVTE